MTSRWMRVGALLLVAMGATIWVHGKEGEDASTASAVADTPRPEKQRAPADALPERLALERLRQRDPAGMMGDPFSSKSWYVPPPPPPPVQAEPPPPPKAPPLPFKYMGQFEDPSSGKWVIYLARGDESFSVTPGDQFASDYEFVGLDRGRLIFRYLPLSTTQSLSIDP